MENASKALLISGGILIAMLVISIGVYLFATYSDVGSSYEQTMEATEIQKFNSNFLKFEGRDDITIHEIVTLAEFAKQYKKQTGIHSEVIFRNKDLNSNEDIIELIQNNSTNYFKCTNINYANNGKINKITFQNT